MSFVAVVVSYNRIELLKKCLHALEHQTRALDEIIVVDNGSTDGSPDYVRQMHPLITLFQTSKNLGGAGGFSWGLEIAMAHEHDAAWIMDDDAEPELDAFEPLAACFDSMVEKPAFLASLVTAGRDTFNDLNQPTISQSTEKQLVANKLDGIAIDAATFVGVLINLRIAERTHLPLSDFFIWVDDMEYTQRLSHKGLALTIPSSRVNHPNTRPASLDMGSRLFYYVRNNLWFVRERSSSVSKDLLDTVGVALHCVKQFSVSKNKVLWLTSTTRGWWQGLFKRPRHQLPGSLLSSLTPAQRAAIGC
ncbi:hypothetical protein GCM10009785_11130 [Brooklawnia cerclae]|uniref:GT2 family glycosyltransferase n=1 Tax=Brooklawnia cerclae TaxID=349934 RepID=A0ABX0SMV9_9ACTN|nr:glycosyltransferase family 2 protein [Brooklawnia cerclae]NIH58658.1 GT2 family glycosyltransferase [Brooklawnia cerclae]